MLRIPPTALYCYMPDQPYSKVRAHGIFSEGRERQTRLTIYAGIAVIMLFLVITGLITHKNLNTLSNGAAALFRNAELQDTLTSALAHIKDGETGQRGYLLTVDERYLDDYAQSRAAALENIRKLQRMVGEDLFLEELHRLTVSKFDEIDQTLTVMRTEGSEAALDIIDTDQGKRIMDEIRDRISQYKQALTVEHERQMLAIDSAYRSAIISGIAVMIVGLLLTSFMAWMFYRGTRERALESWRQQLLTALSALMIGKKNLHSLGDDVLTLMCREIGALAGVFYTQQQNVLRCEAMYGISNPEQVPTEITPGQGLIGEALRNQQLMVLRSLPADYFRIGSALGSTEPGCSVIMPVLADERVVGVVEFGFLAKPDRGIIETLDAAASGIGAAIRSVNFQLFQHKLLEQTQQQSEELQAQSEELRVANEELEEQGRVLRESRAALQKEKEDTARFNQRLNSQNETLAAQRDELVTAKRALETTAAELQQASQYKSEFLANMSHELRTPLNSMLILSQLLKENAKGNLNAEQIDFAATIHSSGNDLLSIINDILDLSKVEAGQLEICSGPVFLPQILADLKTLFAPVADRKSIELAMRLDGAASRSIHSDHQRLEQILRNLIANAIKFTERGSVSLVISQPDQQSIAFSVRDTGIGIEADQLRAIFEAFRQADGAISRRFGGTGLGLSISLRLAHLLGGRIEVTSEPGAGSCFTLYIPLEEASVTYADVEASACLDEAGDSTSSQNSEPVSAEAEPLDAAVDQGRIVDSQPVLPQASAAAGSIILIVEDDRAFAKILANVVSEQGFGAHIAGTAGEVIPLLDTLDVRAIILDIGLPDGSGLVVLEQIKRNNATRHIPVHVISGADCEHAARALGASSYLLKPVDREGLVHAVRTVESQLSRGSRRVLVVEDDAVQRRSIEHLLASREIEIVTAESASRCFELLKADTFDCMVLDLSLPDESGFAVLETISREEQYAFPPVIVYTGRDLSSDEEQRLRQYSNSIIIKGARSPERLLDEVTLFLHQIVSDLTPQQQQMLAEVHQGDQVLKGRHVLVVEDDIRNIYALVSILEPHQIKTTIARNGEEALNLLGEQDSLEHGAVDLVLMDVMMPKVDGLTALKAIREQAAIRDLPVIMLTAKAMMNDRQRCLDAGATDYLAKPIDVEKLLSMLRVWMPQ